MDGVVRLREDPLTAIYARLGWHITPLKGKRPFQKNWTQTALCDVKRFDYWLGKGHNIGLVTGSLSDVAVIDVDPRNGGDTSLASLVQKLGVLPKTITCKTGGGGTHLYFKNYPSAKSSKPIAGIDYQADGRCVVLPPSVHPDTGILYEWETTPGQIELAELPEPWRAAMAGTIIDDGPILEGKRNNSLFQMAKRLYASGASESSVFFQVSEANAEQCKPSLPDDEVRLIVASALRYRPSGESLKTQFQNIVWRWNLTSTEKLFLQALASWSDIDGKNCWPTQEQLAERTGLAIRTIKNLSARLEKAGWFQRFTHRRATGSGFNYSYRLTLPNENLILQDVHEVHYSESRSANPAQKTSIFAP